MKPQLKIGLVNFAAMLNCCLAFIAICYGANQLGSYLDNQRTIHKIEEEYKRNVTSNGRIIPNHPPGSLTAPAQVTYTLPSVSSWQSGSIVMLSSGGSGSDLSDGVELKTEEEKKVFNQWFYYTGDGKEYFSYLKKDAIPDAEGNYGKHLQVSVKEYVWMMQWKFQNEKKD